MAQRLRRYRVKWVFDNGMTFSDGFEEFTAYDDNEARRKAREIADKDDFELEQFRKVKVGRAS